MRAYKRFKDFVNESLLLEVGEASARAFSYELVYGSNMVEIYNFTTDSGVKYEVEANRGNPNPDINYIVQISFSAEGSVEVVVNRGELYKVMATVMQITREILENNPEIRIILIEPTSNSVGDRRRHRLYLAYIKREWPHAVIKKKDDEIYIKIK